MMSKQPPRENILDGQGVLKSAEAPPFNAGKISGVDSNHRDAACEFRRRCAGAMGRAHGVAQAFAKNTVLTGI